MTTRPQALEAVAEAARRVMERATRDDDYESWNITGQRFDALGAALDALATLDALPTTPAAPDDDPELDATDAAHPAWWRGNDYAFEQMRRQLTTRLGAPPGTCWQALLDAAESEAKAKARRAAAAKVDALSATPEAVEAPLDDVAAIYARDAKDGDGHPDHYAGIESVWWSGEAAGYARRGREVVARLRERAAEHRRLASVTLVVSFQKHEESIADALEAAAKELEGR